MMKRLFSLLLALLLACSFTACRRGAQTAPAAEPPMQEFSLLPAEEPPEELSSAPASSAEAQAPPAASGSETPAAEVLPGETPSVEAQEGERSLPEDGSYTSKEDVALYLHLYGHLPDNFITKKEAEALGWNGGSLEPYAPGKCIGGNRFGNYEGMLPDVAGRRWTECDIDTLGAKSRGAKRIVFSNDGLIYYTGDHYASFELLYGEVSS